jgi:hypothetical protein
MMATEAVDARHEAILCLHRATLAIEAGCLHQAETHALSAVAWLRNVTTPDQNLKSADLSSEPAWEYRP